MFGLRHKRTTRDRQSGLLFAWRLPVGDSLRLCTAVAVVALIATGFAAAVRVRIGEGARPLDRRASVVIVPDGGEWKAMRMQALEAGPFPARIRLAEDSAFLASLTAGLRDSFTPGVEYRPEWREIPDIAAAPPPVVSPVLPPLPALEPQPAADPVAPTPPLIVLLGGATVEAPEIPPPAIAARSRHLLSYHPDGRILQVVGLDAEADDAVGSWLRRARIVGGDKNGGWIAVEVEP